MARKEFRTAQDIKADFKLVREAINLRDGHPVPIGIGFIGWILDITEASDDPRLEAILEEKPMAIWFAFGVNLAKYVEQVKVYDSKREHKTLIFVVVSSVEDALRAANEWKVDVIVVQGALITLYLPLRISKIPQVSRRAGMEALKLHHYSPSFKQLSANFPRVPQLLRLAVFQQVPRSLPYLLSAHLGLLLERGFCSRTSPPTLLTRRIS